MVGTIAAVATGVGEAGIGIVRISGDQAIAIGERAFLPRGGGALGKRRSHTVSYGWVVDSTKTRVDEALALIMRGPRSFTGEDVVELHCHGGQVAVRRVLNAVLSAGARLAEPGEFSRRAFLNGRVDLSQAEAIVDIIRAKTDRAMVAAVNQLRGDLGSTIGEMRRRLLECMAHLEADIDFPELELEVQTQQEATNTCKLVAGQVERLLSGAREGRLLREGVRAVIAGRPNVGKSSLMNRLAREYRSIVTEIPGTTRDAIENWIEIKGLPIVLVDTAGIRRTEDRLEQAGVDRSRAMLTRADLILVVIDATEGLTAEDVALVRGLPVGVPWIGIANKIDMVEAFDAGILSRVLGSEVMAVSAETGVGVDALEEAIGRCAGAQDMEESMVANSRHEECLRRGLAHLQSAIRASANGLGSDFVAIDVRSSWEALGEITGETVEEDLLNRIFSRFCIGK